MTNIREYIRISKLITGVYDTGVLRNAGAVYIYRR